MARDKYLREITTLDPEQDAQRITYIVYFLEFPFDTTRSLEFALYRTFAVPAISALLEKTGELGRACRSAMTIPT